MFSDSLPEELTRARQLLNEGKLNEAREIITNFEESREITPEDQVSVLLIKGRVYLYKQRIRKALQKFEVAYQMCQDLGLILESIEALIGKAYIGIIGDIDKATAYFTDAERRLNSLTNDPSVGMLRRDLLLIKSWILFLQINLSDAAELANECLKLTEEAKFGNKLDLARTYWLLGWIVVAKFYQNSFNVYQTNYDKALEYAMKSLEYHNKLNHTVSIADDYTLIAMIYRLKGDYNQALQYCKRISIKEIPGRSKLVVFRILAGVYFLKGRVNKAIKYGQQAVALAEELNIIDLLSSHLMDLGQYYQVSGKKSLAEESFERTLMLSEKWGLIYHMARSLSLLTTIYIDERSREKANRYFSRLSELYDQIKDTGKIDISAPYLLSKAYMLKTSIRMRDRVEAQALYKELIDRFSMGTGLQLIICLGNLCDLLLEELSIYNAPEILDEVLPLITKSLEIAETAHNYLWLAETKLLQAKLALIQMNIEEAKKLMIEAQRIADLHGFNLLAYRISGEHDKLLDQIDVWDTIKKDEAPMAERIKLASTNEVLERIRGKRVVEPSESVDEQSTVLLILAEGGVLVFSYAFSDEWMIDEDLFSSFLSAFKSFSNEFFSKGLDRVKFGDDMMLMESIGSFSFCYLFKGQTYLARQKLTKFIEEIQNNSSLWQSLERHYKTSQILELKESPQLESLITEIFTSKS